MKKIMAYAPKQKERFHADERRQRNKERMLSVCGQEGKFQSEVERRKDGEHKLSIRQKEDEIEPDERGE